MEGGPYCHVQYVINMLKDRSQYLYIAVVVFVVYLAALGNSFTYDDHHYIVESEYIKGWKAFFSIFWDGYLSIPSEKIDHSRPLMPLSLALDYTLWGPNPLGYHLTNITLHAINSVLLYALACYISTGWVPIAASLLFAVHPVHVEPVAGVTFREDLLVTFFYLSAILFYIWFRISSKKLHYTLSIIAFILALLSKEMAATLPLTLLCYEYFFPGEKKVAWYYSLPYWCLLTFYLYFLYLVYSNLPTPPVHSESFWSVFKVLSFYAKLLLFPMNLHVDYNLHGTYFLEWMVFLGILLTLVSVVYVIRGRGRAGPFAVAFFFITLIPVLNIIPTFSLIADRFLYLPSAGFCIFIAEGLYRRQLASIRVPSMAVIALLLAFYSVVTFDRVKVWRDDFTLWSDALKKSPQSVRAHVAIGTQYINEGRDDEALSMLQKAIEIRPDYDKGYYNLGVVYMRKGYMDAAIMNFKKALEINPGYAKAHFNLGLALAKKGRYDEAVTEYEKALKFMPNNAILYNNLGNAYNAKGMYDKAIIAYERAVSIDPDYADAYYNRGNAFKETGRYNQAISSYERSIILNPMNASAYFNMGNVHLLLGRRDKAISAYEAALKANPGHQGARDALKLMWEG